MIIKWSCFRRVIVNQLIFFLRKKWHFPSIVQGPYCVKAKNVLGQYKLKDYKVVELDEIDNGNEYQQVLGQITNARSVPRVFINGECIGGGDDTEKLDQNGDLVKRLKKIDAIEN